MENLEFILGALSTVGIFLVGYASIGVFKVKTEIKKVNQSLEHLSNDFNNDIKDLQLYYQNQIDDIYRQIDSRFDKLENKINKK